jgi:hypothetical protein
MSTGGKGSKPRPIEIPIDEFDKNWDTIFEKVTNEGSCGNANCRCKTSGTMCPKCSKTNL